MDKGPRECLCTMEFTSYYWQVIRALADKYNADLTKPYKNAAKKFREVLLYGTGDEKLNTTTPTEADSCSTGATPSKALRPIWSGGTGDQFRMDQREDRAVHEYLGMSRHATAKGSGKSFWP